MKKPKVLLFDIETSPLLVYAWQLGEQRITLDQIVKDWSVISWSARWLGEKTIMYEDVSKQKDLRDDRRILKGIWKLLDEADIVITQNGKSFDVKKLNARFMIHDMPIPSYFEHIDTLVISKKYCKFTSHKLEYMAKALKVPFQKLKDRKYPGLKLWDECLKGNKEAWAEMKLYNSRDVLALEGVYSKVITYDGDATIDYNKYRNDYTEDNYVCKCGSKDRNKDGIRYKKSTRFQKYRCTNCGAPSLGLKALPTEKL